MDMYQKRKIRKEKGISYTESNYSDNEKKFQNKIKTKWRNYYKELYWEDFIN